jgi:hypothetical protein
MESVNNNSGNTSSDEGQLKEKSATDLPVFAEVQVFSDVPVILENTGSDFGLGEEGDAYRKTQPPVFHSRKLSMISVDRDMEDHYIGLNVLNTRSVLGA